MANEKLINVPGYSDFDADADRRIDLSAGGLDIDLSALSGVLRVSGGVAYANASHSDLSGIGANDHHVQLHAVSHNSGEGDEVNHDNLAGFVATEHVSLPNILTNVLSDHNLAAHTTLGLFDQHSDVDHNQTTNYVADEHIAHSGVSISGGGILSGGGTITSDRTISLAHGDVDHNQTANYVVNEHKDHSGISISPGTGLIGGGDITTTRTLALDINGLAADASPDGDADYITTYDADAGTHKKVLLNDIPGVEVDTFVELTDTPVSIDSADIGKVVKVSDSLDLEFVDEEASLSFVIDGGGNAITTGVKGDLKVPFDCTITSVALLADQSGAIVIDIWKDTYANFPPLVGDSIAASALPTITASGDKSQDSTLTGWTTSLTKGDILRFSVDSVATIQRVTLSLEVDKT